MYFQGMVGCQMQLVVYQGSHLCCHVMLKEIVDHLYDKYKEVNNENPQWKSNALNQQRPALSSICLELLQSKRKHTVNVTMVLRWLHCESRLHIPIDGRQHRRQSFS